MLPSQVLTLPDLSESAIGRLDSVKEGKVTAHGRDVQKALLAGAEAGLTLTEILERTGVSIRKLASLRRADPTFSDKLEEVQFQASAMTVEEIRLVPGQESDVRVMRVKIEALAKYLELRWPERYGRRVNVQVQHMDLRGALAEARARAAQAIDSTCKRLDVQTDSVSVLSIDDLL